MKLLLSILLVFLLSSCGNNSNTSVLDYIFSKDYFECNGTISDRPINADGKGAQLNSVQSKITVLLDKFKNKLTIEGDDQIQNIGVYFLVCSTENNISKINAATCESEAETTKRLEGYGRTQIDIKNWIELNNEKKVSGELNRENGDLHLYSSVKNDTSNIEITGTYKCKSKS
jgi:hypothetical protein